MKHPDPLTVLEWLASIVLALAILLAIAWAARAIAPVLLLFALALVFAFVLDPVVSLSERRLKVPRAAGAVGAYLLVVGGLVLLGSSSFRRSLSKPGSFWDLASMPSGRWS